jgi:hypothetical protein
LAQFGLPADMPRDRSSEDLPNNPFWLSQLPGGLPPKFDYCVVRSVAALILTLPHCDRGRVAVGLLRHRHQIGADPRVWRDHGGMGPRPPRACGTRIRCFAPTASLCLTRLMQRWGTKLRFVISIRTARYLIALSSVGERRLVTFSAAKIRPNCNDVWRTSCFFRRPSRINKSTTLRGG